MTRPHLSAHHITHQPRRRRTRSRGRVTAGSLLLAAVIGPPALLLALLGNPMHVPAALRTTDVLTRALDDATVLWLLAAIAWLLWIHLLATLAVELLRQTRGSSLRVPLPGLLFGANAALASHLIAALLISSHPGATGLTPATARLSATSLAPAPPMAVAATSTVATRDLPAVVSAAPADNTGHAQAAASSGDDVGDNPAGIPRNGSIACRVQPPHGRHHDTLWDIAERHLGDGTRWREIFALNDGRAMPDGQRLTRASLIRPGWVLQLPADAIQLDLDRVTPTSPSSPTPRAAHDTAPAAVTPPRKPTPEHTRAEHSAGRADQPPNAQLPRTQADGAHEPAAAHASPSVPASPARNPTPAPEEVPAPDPAEHSAHAVAKPVAETGGLLALAALALLAALTRRRKIAARRRPAGVRPTRPTAAMVAAETRLRQDARAAEDVAATVRLAMLLAARHAPQVRVKAVWQHHDGGIELVLTEHAPNGPVPQPFQSTLRGWLLPADAQRHLYAVRQDGALRHDRHQRIEEELEAHPDPFPLLLPVGTQDGSACLVNLELYGLISVTTTDHDPAAAISPPPEPNAAMAQERATASGPDATGEARQGADEQDAPPVISEAGDAVLRPILAAWVQQLAGAPWAELVRIHLPVTWASIGTGLDRVSTGLIATTDVGRLTPDDRAAVARHGSLEAARRADSGAAGLIRSHLYVGGRCEELPDGAVAAALDPVEPAVVLLAASYPDAHTWRLDRDGLLNIPDIADRLTPLHLDAEQHAVLLRLLEHAEDPPQASSDDPHRQTLHDNSPPVAASPSLTASATTAPADSDDEHPATGGEEARDGASDLTMRGDRTDVATVADEVANPAAPDARARLVVQQPDPAVEQQRGAAAVTPSPPAPVGPVEVAILGPLHLSSTAPGPAPRQQSLEILVYLALHRRPITLEALSAALWPDRPYSNRNMRNRVSDLRPYIHNRIDRLPGGGYQLTDRVVTDWQRFRGLAQGNPTQQLAALALVRARPFDTITLDWFHLEGQYSEIEASIVDLALEVGDRALRQRDYETARTAALAGLRGCPFDERLYRIAMQSAAARGASGELRQLRHQLAVVLDEELEPDDTVQPATEALYRELSERDQLHARRGPAQ